MVSFGVWTRVGQKTFYKVMTWIRHRKGHWGVKSGGPRWLPGSLTGKGTFGILLGHVQTFLQSLLSAIFGRWQQQCSLLLSVLQQHAHTHPFNGPFSGTTQVSWYQKGKTNLDFTEARDSEWQWHHLDICKSAPHSRQITTPAPHCSVFYRPDALPAAQPTASKHWRQYCSNFTYNVSL